MLQFNGMRHEKNYRASNVRSLYRNIMRKITIILFLPIIFHDKYASERMALVLRCIVAFEFVFQFSFPGRFMQ